MSLRPPAKKSVRRAMFRRLATAALLMGLAAAHASELAVIELNSRTAEEVIPLLRPMLAPGGTISGLKDKLVIGTTAANLAELRKILAVVDARPRRLQITVRQGAVVGERELDVDISGSAGSDDVRVTLPGSPTGAGGRRAKGASSGSQEADGVHVQARAASSTRARSALQTVQVLEGNGAYIAVGQSIPVRASSAGGGEYVEYRDVVTGFYATPRVSGDRVTVALATSSDTVRDRVTGAAQVQRADTVVSGRLGEWIEVGSVSQAADRRDAGMVWYHSGTSGDERSIYIKVEELR